MKNHNGKVLISLLPWILFETKALGDNGRFLPYKNFHWRTRAFFGRPQDFHWRPPDFHWRPPDFHWRPDRFSLETRRFSLETTRVSLKTPRFLLETPRKGWASFLGNDRSFTERTEYQERSYRSEKKELTHMNAVLKKYWNDY